MTPAKVMEKLREAWKAELKEIERQEEFMYFDEVSLLLLPILQEFANEIREEDMKVVCWRCRDDWPVKLDKELGRWYHQGHYCEASPIRSLFTVA